MTFQGHFRSSETSWFARAHVISHYRSIVTMMLSCIVSHIQPDIGRKSQHLYTQPVFNSPYRNFKRYLVLGKLEWGYHMLRKYDRPMFSRFNTTPER